MFERKRSTNSNYNKRGTFQSAKIKDSSLDFVHSYNRCVPYLIQSSFQQLFEDSVSREEAGHSTMQELQDPTVAVAGLKF